MFISLVPCNRNRLMRFLYCLCGYVYLRPSLHFSFESADFHETSYEHCTIRWHPNDRRVSLQGGSDSNITLFGIVKLYSRMVTDLWKPIAVAARSKALEHCGRRFESHSKHGCLCAFILCLYCSVRRADAPSKESCRLCIGLRNWKAAKVQQRAVMP
jgi:hypothetical protein